jgi:hypothetical protein
MHMNKKKKLTLARWVDQVASGASPDYATAGRDGWYNRLRVDSDSVSVGNQDIARLRRTPTGRTVAFQMPPFGGLRISRYLRRLLQQRRVPYYQIPWRSISASGIAESTIEVVDVRWGRGLFAFPDTLIRGDVPTRMRTLTGRGSRPAYFLSGIDRSEWRESFFFCELPPGAQPATVAEAYEALKPESVKEAERLGLKVRRQGDIFAIETPTFTPDQLYVQELVQLLDTNHVADEAVLVGNTSLYARGRMRHRPSGRRPDHRTLNLGKRWHLIVKNTVPLAG